MTRVSDLSRPGDSDLAAARTASARPLRRSLSHRDGHGDSEATGNFNVSLGFRPRRAEPRLRPGAGPGRRRPAVQRLNESRVLATVTDGAAPAASAAGATAAAAAPPPGLSVGQSSPSSSSPQQPAAADGTESSGPPTSESLASAGPRRRHESRRPHLSSGPPEGFGPGFIAPSLPFQGDQAVDAHTAGAPPPGPPYSGGGGSGLSYHRTV